MSYLLDKDGNVFKAHVISNIPEGFVDVTKDLAIDEDAEGLDSQYTEAVLIEATDAIEGVLEHWTNGENTVYDVNDIPTLTDGNGDPYLDPDYNRVEAVEAVAIIPAHYRIKKTSTADQEIRQAKMDQLGVLRSPLLAEADIEINKLEDNSGDSSSWRTYRQALRDITETYKKVDGNWKVSVDSLVVADFIFPVKP